MPESEYLDWIKLFDEKPKFWKALNFTAQIFEAFVFGLYAGLLWALVKNWDGPTFYHCILVPAVSFVVISLVRRLLKTPRPYEMFGFVPMLSPGKRKKNSFPSRHVFSAFMIAMTCLQVNVILAILCFVFGLYLAFFRVVSGMHFIRDVFWGAALGVICGVIGYYIIF